MLSAKPTEELKKTSKIQFPTKQETIKSDVIVEYNQTMGRVDNPSRVIVPNCIQRKGVKSEADLKLLQHPSR